MRCSISNFIPKRNKELKKHLYSYKWHTVGFVENLRILADTFYLVPRQKNIFWSPAVTYGFDINATYLSDITVTLLKNITATFRGQRLKNTRAEYPKLNT